MKSPTILLVIFGLLSPLYAQTTILYEDFEGAAPGTMVDGYNGWSGDFQYTISSTTLDQGQSVDCGGTVPTWPQAVKSFSNTVGTGEYCVLTGTLYAPAASKDYAQIDIRKQADSLEDSVQCMLGYGELIFAYDAYGEPNYVDVRVPNAGVPMDVQVVIADGLSDFYYRENGETVWNSAGSINAGVPSLYQYMHIQGHSYYVGNIDSINLTKTDGNPANDTVLLSEDFESAAPGTALNGYNGWTADNILTISSTTIDENQSLEVSEVSTWPKMSKSFSHTLANDEYYTLSGTLYAPAATRDYAQLGINQLTDSTTEYCHIMLGYNELIFETSHSDDGSLNIVLDVRVPKADTPMDVKMDIKEGRTDCYYRLNGDQDWIHAGGGDVGWPSQYDQVTMQGHDGYVGGLDTISLTVDTTSGKLPGDANEDGSVDVSDLGILATNYGTIGGMVWSDADFTGDGNVDVSDLGILATNYGATSPSAVPEPSALSLLGLVALTLVWRRRK